jgi:hypothetical protein
LSISKVELLELMSTKNSVAELLTEKFNNTAPYYYNVIRKLVKEYNLEDNYRELTLRGRSFTNYCRVNRKLSNESIFCKGEFKGAVVRNRVLRDNLIPYRCAIEVCPTNKMIDWCSKKIPFQLDHIDGDRTNNELSNLRFLCGICHAQTPTFGSKNKSKIT